MLGKKDHCPPARGFAMPISAISLGAYRLADRISACSPEALQRRFRPFRLELVAWQWRSRPARPRLSSADLGHFARSLSFGRGDLSPPTLGFAMPIPTISLGACHLAERISACPPEAFQRRSRPFRSERVGWQKGSLLARPRLCDADLGHFA